MGFFDLPNRGEDEEPELVDDPFEDLQPGPWIAGVVALDLELARSQQAAVVITRIAAFPDGVELVLKSYIRRGARRRSRRGFEHPMMLHRMGDSSEPVPDEFLRFGVAWPDGGRATNLTGWEPLSPDATAPSHGLEAHGGGGSDREWSQEYWTWPLPEQGELSFVVEWPAFGIDETATSLDSTLLVDAALRARPVWPDDTGRSSHLNRADMIRAIRERAGGNDSRRGLFFDL